MSLQNRYFESIKALEYALELDPNFLEARVNLSVVLADLGYYHEAKSTFEEFLDDLSYSEEKLKSFLLKETKIDKDYLSLAKKFFDQKNYSFAQEELLKCLKVNPKNSDARELLAHIHYERQDYPRAEKDLDILLTEYPTNTKLLRLKALCALKQKNKDKLEQITKELRLKAPTDQSTHIFIEACRSLDMNL